MYFYDIVAARFNLNDNTQGWTNLEKRELLKTRLVNGASTSYLFEKGNNLHVLYLDSPKNIELSKNDSHKIDDLELVIEHNNSTMVIGKFNQKDHIERLTCTSELAANFHLKCRIVPDGSGPTPNNYLCLRLTDDSFLVFIEDNNVGRWAMIKNIN